MTRMSDEEIDRLLYFYSDSEDEDMESTELQLVRTLAALKAERERVRELQKWQQEMVAIQASGGKLDGYRELGAKLCATEAKLEGAKGLQQHDVIYDDFGHNYVVMSSGMRLGRVVYADELQAVLDKGLTAP